MCVSYKLTPCNPSKPLLGSCKTSERGIPWAARLRAILSGCTDLDNPCWPSLWKGRKQCTTTPWRCHFWQAEQA